MHIFGNVYLEKNFFFSAFEVLTGECHFMPRMICNIVCQGTRQTALNYTTISSENAKYERKIIGTDVYVTNRLSTTVRSGKFGVRREIDFSLDFM
jgi:hypothetical protein